MEIIIEEITRGQKVLNRHRSSTNSINIGRGYNNDIIISDPHICAEHLQLQFDGEHWLVQDKGSINGSFLKGKKENLIRHKVKSGDILSLGNSQIRLLFPNHPVAESITISPFESLINVVSHPIAVALNLVIFTLMACWIINLNNAEEVTITQLLVPSIGLTLAFVFWPIVLSLISHLTKHDARFWSQLGICFVFFNLMFINDAFEYIIQFNTSSHFSIDGVVFIIPAILTFCLLWFNCYVGFDMTTRRRNIISAALVIIFFSGDFIIELSQKPDFNPLPKFNTTIISPMFLFASSSTVETFVNNSKKLFNEVDKVVVKEKKK